MRKLLQRLKSALKTLSGRLETKKEKSPDPISQETRGEDLPSAVKSGFVFSQRSLNNLEGVHPDLVAVAHRALQITPVDFVVIEGVRSIERQKQLFESGASRTMNSRHLTGHAIDVAAWVGGTVRWDWPLYDVIGASFKAAAKELDVPFVWGGDWTTFRDGPHNELDRVFYK